MAHIVHFGKFYSPDAGGIESVTLSLAQAAVLAGHSVTVVCFQRSPAKTDEVVRGVCVLRAPIVGTIHSQPLSLRYLVLCLKCARTADVVHMHSPNMLGALCSIFLASRVRLLVHWHSDVIDKGWLGKVFRVLESALLRKANCIVATTKAYAEASYMLDKFSEKLAVVPIGVPDIKRSNEENALPALISERTLERKIILAVGRLVPYKGFDVLIEAAKTLNPETFVVIVGGGPLEGELRAMIDDLGVGDRVMLAGRLSDSDLQALFERAALYCLSSTTRAEAFGVVLLEAMAYGLPIVATNIPGSGVSWVNKHDVSGLNVPVRDPVALAEACNKIISSDRLHDRLACGARDRYQECFNENISISKTLTIYDSLSRVADS